MMTAVEKHTLEVSLESYKWDSEDQKQGYLAFIKYTLDQGMHPGMAVNPQIAWQIQKDHESYVWVRDTFGDQITNLQGEIRRLQGELHDSKQMTSILQKTFEANSDMLKIVLDFMKKPDEKKSDSNG